MCTLRCHVHGQQQAQCCSSAISHACMHGRHLVTTHTQHGTLYAAERPSRACSVAAAVACSPPEPVHTTRCAHNNSIPHMLPVRHSRAHDSYMLVTCASAHQDLDVLEQCCCRSCCRCQAQHTHAPAMAGSTQNNPKAWWGNPNPLRCPLSTPHPSHQVDWSAAHINHTSACSIVNCSCVVGTTQHTRQRLAPCSCTVAASGMPKSPAATCSSPSPGYRCMLPPTQTPCPESLPHPQHLPESTLPTSLHACLLHMPHHHHAPCHRQHPSHLTPAGWRSSPRNSVRCS